APHHPPCARAGPGFPWRETFSPAAFGGYPQDPGAARPARPGYRAARRSLIAPLTPALPRGERAHLLVLAFGLSAPGTPRRQSWGTERDAANARRTQPEAFATSQGTPGAVSVPIPVRTRPFHPLS